MHYEKSLLTNKGRGNQMKFILKRRKESLALSSGIGLFLPGSNSDLLNLLLAQLWKKEGCELPKSLRCISPHSLR